MSRQQRPKSVKQCNTRECPQLLVGAGNCQTDGVFVGERNSITLIISSGADLTPVIPRGVLDIEWYEGELDEQ